MSDWLIDHKQALYLLLAAALVLTLALWWRSRKRHFLIAAALVVLLGVGLFVLSQFVESDGEQMARKVREVAAGVTSKDLDAAFKHVSESFDRGGVTKAQFRKFCQTTIDAGRVNQVQVWD